MRHRITGDLRICVRGDVYFYPIHIKSIARISIHHICVFHGGVENVIAPVHVRVHLAEKVFQAVVSYEGIFTVYNERGRPLEGNGPLIRGIDILH